MEVCFTGGLEYLATQLDLTTGQIKVITHEAHKPQPRFIGPSRAEFSKLSLIREEDALPGLPYEGSAIRILLDDREVARVGEADFLPESDIMFRLVGEGELVVSSVAVSGPERPRPEYVHVGAWQQSVKSATAENVEALTEGVRQAAEAGVAILLTPETSLTGLRPADRELDDREAIQSHLRQFCKAAAGTPSAPYTLIGYPEWVPGSEVDGATLDEVKVNCHRFVCPDGTLGPRMAKVHSCEPGFWHGRSYNLQRVRGVEVAVGVCHDGRYQDVWTTGVMGGARLCLHPQCGAELQGDIPTILAKYGLLAGPFDAWWVMTNARGGSAITSPKRLACGEDGNLPVIPVDLTEANPTYPEYSSMGDILTHARIRLWDVHGAFPMRTLRSGKKGYENWSRLVPEIVDV